MGVDMEINWKQAKQDEEKARDKKIMEVKKEIRRKNEKAR